MKKEVIKIDKIIKKALKIKKFKYKGLAKSKRELAKKGFVLCLYAGEKIYCEVVEKDKVDYWYQNVNKNCIESEISPI